jgi:hypothetical protein
MAGWVASVYRSNKGPRVGANREANKRNAGAPGQRFISMTI